VTEDRDNETLAEQAAAWVPPWHRRPDEPEPPPREPEVVHEPEPEPGEIVDEWGADDEPEDPVDPIEAARATMYALVESVDAPVAEPAPAFIEEDIYDEDEDEDDVDEDDIDDEPIPHTTDLGAALEAILLVVDEPVAEAMLADVLDATIPEVTARLEALASEYTAQGRGFDLRRAAGGWRLYTRGEYAAYVERFVLDGQSVRLTQAALETLAVIAYQQPATRSRISAIRGVNCDGVVRTLMTRGLIEECGTQPESGAFLYRTTSVFLEKLGLDSVEDLPPLAPFLPDDVNGLADAQR
jgi:segregation and condensation protein B